MKHLKKVLVFILSVAMIITAFAGLTFADEDTNPGPHFSYAVSKTEAEVGDTVTLTVSTTAMTVGSITGGFYYDPSLLELDTATLPQTASLTASGNGSAISLTVSENENHNGVGFYYGGTSEEGILYNANPEFLQVSFTAIAAGTAIFTYYENVDGLDEYWIEGVLEGPSVTITNPAAEEGYITYNGQKLYDSVIAGCLDPETGNALLTDVLTAANIEATGDCCYVFTSADGTYSATLDADILDQMVLFDNDGVAGAPYSWRNSVTDTSMFTGGWYKVTGLATIETHDHAYDAETHLCTNPISVSRGKYEDCGEEDPTIATSKPAFSKHNLLLSGEIGVQFLVKFPEGFDTTGCYVDFIAEDGRTGNMQYADATQDTDNGGAWFRFDINALELADEITATLHYGDGETIENTFSAIEYIQTVKEDPVFSENQKLRDLVSALQAYGHYLQASGWTDGKDHTAIAAPAQELTEDSIAAAKSGLSEMANTDIIKELDGSGIMDAKFTLVLNSKTVIGVYVKPESGAKVTSTGFKKTKLSGEVYYLYKTPKIGPKNLGKLYTVKAETNVGTTAATVKGSAMSYVKAVLDNPDFAQEKQYAMAAYYYYYLAAQAY